MLDKIKELRERTNISLAKCKSALETTNGNIDEAIIILQKQGFNDAVKKASREAKEGIIYSYVHMNKIGVMVEINSETDFSARSEPFKIFVERVALQIAAMEPLYLSREDVEIEAIADLNFEIFKAQAGKAIAGKPESVVNKILEGKMNKWYSTVCLLDQESVAVEGKTIDNLRTELVAKIGENVVIRRFVRWELGK